jgi:predicted nucleotidyltransferase
MGKYHRILARLKSRKDYIELNRKCKVAFVGLFGSQNYGLDDSNSDIDCVIVTMPSLDDLIGGKPDVKTLTQVEFSSDSSDDGLVKLMDIRDFAKQLSKGSFVNLESLFSDYVIVDDSFRDFYNVRKEIYDRYLWNYQNAVYGAIRNILNDYDRNSCANGEEERQSKRMYEALRLKNLYGQLMNESSVQLNSRPEFYIADLSERCFIGNVKSGVLDSAQFFDEVKNIEPPVKDEPNPPGWFNAISFANGVVKKYILYRDFDQNCDKAEA